MESKKVSKVEELDHDFDTINQITTAMCELFNEYLCLFGSEDHAFDDPYADIFLYFEDVKKLVGYGNALLLLGKHGDEVLHRREIASEQAEKKSTAS